MTKPIILLKNKHKIVEQLKKEIIKQNIIKQEEQNQEINKIILDIPSDFDI